MFEEFPLVGYTSFQPGIIIPKVGKAPLSQVFSPKIGIIGFSKTLVGLEDNGALCYIKQCSAQPSPEGIHTWE